MSYRMAGTFRANRRARRDIRFSACSAVSAVNSERILGPLCEIPREVVSPGVESIARTWSAFRRTFDGEDAAKVMMTKRVALFLGTRHDRRGRGANLRDDSRLELPSTVGKSGSRCCLCQWGRFDSACSRLMQRRDSFYATGERCRSRPKRFSCSCCSLSTASAPCRSKSCTRLSGRRRSFSIPTSRASLQKSAVPSTTSPRSRGSFAPCTALGTDSSLRWTSRP